MKNSRDGPKCFQAAWRINLPERTPRSSNTSAFRRGNFLAAREALLLTYSQSTIGSSSTIGVTDVTVQVGAT